MLYLSGCLPSDSNSQRRLLTAGVGLMLTPVSQRRAPTEEWEWAADNGCFSAQWEETRWLRWLQRFPNPETAVFATVPDVLADHISTLERWSIYASKVRDLGFRTAFVLQDGASTDLPFGEMDALFIGGTTGFKLSDKAKGIARLAKESGAWIHMGRVNSFRRLVIAKEFGCDSADGTFLAFSPDRNIGRLLAMLEKLEHWSPQQSLFDHQQQEVANGLG